MNKTLRVRPGYGQLCPYTSQDAITIADLDKSKVYTLTFQGDKRSLPQNALQHVWYKQVGDEMGMTPQEVKRYCKLHFGVPIMRSVEDFNERYTRLMKDRYSYEEKLEMMDWLPITSVMTKGMETEYLNTIQQHFAEQGIILESRDD